MTDHISLQSGTELVGDYRIDRVLGAGGFGITYLADELALDRRVTIKEYFPSDFAARSDGSDAVPKSQDCSGDYRWGLDRFIEEAQTLARFDHPNIVRVYRYFRANNTGYMVLHFEEGQSLKSWLRGLKRAPRQKELDAIVPNLLDALELIHNADFLHRDIAPDNIIIRKSGQPVLIDFGSARGEIASHSKTVSALVKPGYSPYEQYAETSSKQGPWTDIYALAGTLYHAVTGKRPPDAPSRMVTDEFIPAREAAIGGYRKGFLNAIDTALNLKIEERPKSVAAWRRELMAPDPQKRGWRAKAPQPQMQAAPKVAEETPPASPVPAKAVAPRAKQAVAQQAPAKKSSRGGGLIDFLDGLKSKPLATPGKDAKAGAQKKQKAKPKSEDAKPSATWRFSTMLKRIKTSPNPINVKPAAVQPEPKARSVPTPKPPRPRRVGRRKQARLRPVLVKLLAGVGVATAAVAMQDRLPWPSSASTSPLTTASIRKAAPPKREPQRLERAFSAHTSSIQATTFADNGRTLLTAGKDGSLKLWDTATGAPVRTIMLPNGPAFALAAHNNKALTGHANGAIALWDLTNGNKVSTFKRNEARVWSVAFVGDGSKFAASSHDWKTALWDVAAPGTPLHVFEGHKSAAQVVAYAQTPRGPVIATGGADKRIKLWHAETFKLLRTYRGHRDFVNHIAFSQDGSRMASASINGNIRVWSTKSRKLYRSYTEHNGPLTGLLFSDGNTRLISSSNDHRIRFWNTRRRRSEKILKIKSGNIASLAFSPASDRLAVSDGQGNVELWSLGGGAKLSAK